MSTASGWQWQVPAACADMQADGWRRRRRRQTASTFGLAGERRKRRKRRRRGGGGGGGLAVNCCTNVPSAGDVILIDAATMNHVRGIVAAAHQAGNWTRLPERPEMAERDREPKCHRSNAVGRWTNGLHHASGQAPLWAGPISDDAPRSGHRDGPWTGQTGQDRRGQRLAFLWGGGD